MESVEPMTNPAAVPAVPAGQVDSNFMAANASAAVGVTTIRSAAWVIRSPQVPDGVS